MEDSYLEGYFKAFAKEVDKEYKSFENTINKMLDRKEEKDMTLDKDVKLYNQFISDLMKVHHEMEDLSAIEGRTQIELIKLNRVFNHYKDALRMPNYDSFAQFYYYSVEKAKKKKDESKKEESAELKGLRKHCIRLSSLNLDPRALVIELNGIYELYGEVLGISLEEIKRTYFVLAENPKADLTIQVK